MRLLGGVSVMNCEVFCANKLGGQPRGERSRLVAIPHYGIGTIFDTGTRSDDVAAPSPHIHLPGESPSATRTYGGEKGLRWVSPVPHMETL
ncbi:hypothetical protein GCM10010412_100870 [Nonomuraea recticatena]|uniref:Uncharacterized protein n=1 Tax=Nonomuraea recticatena TaxID=46178 RepID=A0ABN3TIW2_9ACTN